MAEPKSAYQHPKVPLRRRARQIKAWVRYRRWRGRCDECGGMFLPGHGVFTFGNNDGKQWHDKCMGYVQFRRVAEERLTVLDLITDVWSISMRDVTALMEGRAEREGYETSNAYNLGWRVMYDIDCKRKKRTDA